MSEENLWDPEENREEPVLENEIAGCEDAAVNELPEDTAPLPETPPVWHASAEGSPVTGYPYADPGSGNGPQAVPGKKETRQERKEEARRRKAEARAAKKRAKEEAAAERTPMSPGRKIGFTMMLGAVFGIVAAAAFLGINYAGQQILGNGSKAAPFGEERQYEADGETDPGHGPELPDREIAPDRDLTEPGEQDLQREEQQRDPEDEELTVEEVVEKAMPSMVSITTSSVEQVRSFFGGQTQEYEIKNAASGVLINKTDTQLLIATNEHVVSGSKTITVAFCDDSAVPAEQVGANVTEDLAILAVNLSDLSDGTLEAIRVIEIGDSDACRVGQQVVAIGNALGYGQSVSAGIISALNRDFVHENTSHTVMQTDAAINPGNSGGALLNMKGELIGINEAKYSTTEVEGIGYAIPMSAAQPILDELMDLETREKVDEAHAAAIGITCLTIPDEYVSQGYPAGAYVDMVIEGMAADMAGIEEGDIITSVEGYAIMSADDLVEELQYYEAGTTIEVRISRMYDDRSGYGSLTLKVTLSRKADMPDLESLQNDD